MCNNLLKLLCQQIFLSHNNQIAVLPLSCLKKDILIRCYGQYLTRKMVVQNSYDIQKMGSASSASTIISSNTVPGALSKEQAKELAVKLTSDEREILIIALQECQSLKTKAEYENQIAAFRWRSKFGRPSKVPKLGDVDPTGTYCKIPEDWLLRKYADPSKEISSENVPQPQRPELVRVAVANAIPFIGFGFLDNFVMIVAGDSIETTVGAAIAISTMAAAALGNTISDILGIGSAYYVEKLAQKIGFKPPKLTPIQLDLPKSRLFANIGRVIGVTLGCILGMIPLLVLNKSDENENNEDKK